MIFLWKYKNLIAYALLAIGLAISIFINYIELQRYKAVKAELVTVKTALKTALDANIKCKENVLLTERTNNAYQSDITRLAADVKRLRSLPAKCVPVTRPTSLCDGKGRGTGHVKENGIRSEWLIDYAAESESLRIKLNTCKSFINDVWENQK
jgi:hypothetical protein